MRVVAVAAGMLLAGCMFGHGEFEATPCKPAGKDTFGTLLVRFNETYNFDDAISPVGKCVALEQDDKVLATARIGEDLTAVLNLPVQGEVYITWTEPFPHDRACAEHAYAFVTVPGPANVTLQVGGICY